MKLPDLPDLEIAGVHAWTARPNALKAAAARGQAAFRSRRPGVAARTDAARGARPGLKLPEHFGHNWDALADVARGQRLAGQERPRDRAGARRRLPQGARATGRRSRTSSRKRPSSGRNGTSRSGSSSLSALARPARATRRMSGAMALQDPGFHARRSSTRPTSRVLLIERADFPGLLAIGDRQPGTRRDAARHRHARAARGNRHRRRARTAASSTGSCRNVYEIYPQWRHRYPPGTTHNTEHVFALEVPAPVPVRLEPREHLRHVWLPWREAAAKCFSWSNRAAILLLPQRIARRTRTDRQRVTRPARPSAPGRTQASNCSAVTWPSASAAAFERRALAVRLLRDLGRLVVADVRVERRDQHQRALEQLGDALAVGLDAARAVRVEARAAVGQQAHALQDVVDDERLVDVELEVARTRRRCRRRRRCPTPARRPSSAPRTASG